MKKPTDEQWEAFYWVYSKGLTQEKAAEKLGISRRSLRERIDWLKLKVPDFDMLFDPPAPKTYRLRDSNESKIKEIF